MFFHIFIGCLFVFFGMRFYFLFLFLVFVCMGVKKNLIKSNSCRSNLMSFVCWFARILFFILSALRRESGNNKNSNNKKECERERLSFLYVYVYVRARVLFFIIPCHTTFYRKNKIPVFHLYTLCARISTNECESHLNDRAAASKFYTMKYEAFCHFFVCLIVLCGSYAH